MQLPGILGKSKDVYSLDKSKGVITCTLIGASLGLLISYNRKLPLLMGAVIGGAITGIGSNYFINKKLKK